MWVQQKMVMTTTADPQQGAQNRMMLWTMPLMFGFLTMTFPGGLAIYWIASNIIRIIIQYRISGWGSLIPQGAPQKVAKEKKPKKLLALVEQVPAEQAAVEQKAASAEIAAPSPTQGEKSADAGTGDKRSERRGGYPTRLREVKRHPRRDRGHRPKRR